jgi:hypothetical protein
MIRLSNNKLVRVSALIAAGWATSLLPSVANAQDAGKPAATPAPAAPADAAGKKWKEDAVPAALAARSSPERVRFARELPGILRGETTLDDNGKAVLDGHYGQIAFAEMTHVANLPRLTDARQLFRNRTMRNANMPDAVRSHLNDLIFKQMGKVAHDKGYHPAVRVNAMLMIADLNSKEPTVSGGQLTPATPLATVLIARDGLLDSAGNTTLDPAVRAVAMYGVQRHAEAGIAAGNQAAVQTKLLAILKEKATTPEASQGLAWLKARAANVLETTSPAGGAAAAELANVVIDAASPVDVRCAAARALGAQKGLTAGSIKVPDVVAALGNLHLDACREEIDRAAVEQDTVAPRQVHFRASAVQAALGDGKATGVAMLVPAAEKALVTGIAKNVAETLALVPDENADPTEQLKLKANELEKLLVDNKVLKSTPRAAAAAEAPAADPATTSPDAAVPATTDPPAADAAPATKAGPMADAAKAAPANGGAALKK